MRITHIVWPLVWLVSVTASYYLGSQWAVTELLLTEDAPSISSPEKTTAPTESAKEEAASEESTYINRQEKIAREILTLTPEEFPAALKRYQAMDKNHSAVGMLAVSWAKHDSQAAFEAGLAEENKRYLNIFMGGVFAVWARSEPLEAFEAYQQYLANERVFVASGHVYFGLASVDPDRALAELETYEHNYDNQQTNRMMGIAAALAENDNLLASIQPLDRAENQSTASIIRSDIVRAWLNVDFVGTANLVSDYNASRGDKPFLPTKPIIWLGLDYNRDALLAWAEREDRISGNYSNIIHVTREWRERDADAANAWLRQLPEGETKDSIYESLGPPPDDE